MSLFRGLVDRFIDRVTSRPRDMVIGGDARPYLLRWWIIPRNPFFNIYFHMFLRDDDDRALHDHPWFNLSILLRGRYIEHTIRRGGIHVRKERVAGAVVARSAWAAHRIELVSGMPCVTLFITGPVLRAWGFHCERGWVDWRRFTDPSDTGRIGRGCGES